MKKIVVFLLSLFFALQLSAQNSLLNKKVSLHAKDITIADAIKILRLKYGIQFSYSSNVIPGNKKIQLYLKQVPLDLALRTIFLDTDIGYEVVGSQIVLRRVVMPKPQGRLSTRSRPTAHIKIPDPAPVVLDKVNSLPPDSTKVDTSLQQVKLPQPEVVLTAAVKDSTAGEAQLDSVYQEERSKMRIKMTALRDSLRSKSKWTVRQLDLLFKDIEEEFHQDYLRMRDSIRHKDKDFLPLPKWDSFARRQQQDSTNPDYIHRKAQVTFVYPIGSNGFDSPYYINNVSLNVLGGYNGGVEGVELGGFANVIKSNVRGMQAAGYINVVGGDITGFQGAGFMNLCGARAAGFQGAGFMNIVKESTNGIQAAGFMNVNGTHSKGLQGAGFMNVNGGRSIGVQAAGFININGSNSQGVQAAGFMNVNGGHSTGTQIAGFMNVNVKDAQGMQAAGFGNIVLGTVKGSQISGFLNVARRLYGTQIGVFNFADTIEKGIPIGVLSFVRKGGLKKVEVFGSETFQVNSAFKTGVKHFYNILYLGYQLEPDYFRWAFGYGIGTEVSLGQKAYLDFDLLSMHVNENEEFTQAVNLNNRFQISFGYKLAKGLSLFVGPNINYMISDYTNKDGSYGSKLPVWKIKEYGKYNDQLYWGITAGVRFF